MIRQRTWKGAVASPFPVTFQLYNGWPHIRPPPPALPAGYSFPAIPRRWADEHGSEEMKSWLERFATARAAGKRDESLGILG